MKYFLHDSNSFNDEKITQLYLNYGYEGLGLFYSILEKLAAQEKPINTEVLKSQLNVGKRLDKCWSFMESLGIISSNNGDTFNKQLLNYGEKYQIKKQKNRERIQEWRTNQQVTENVTRYESVSNAPKVNKSKVNKSKVKDNIYLTQPEIEKLKAELGEEKFSRAVEFLSSYKIEKGYKTKSDYLTIKRWVIDAISKPSYNQAKQQNNKDHTIATKEEILNDKF